MKCIKHQTSKEIRRVPNEEAQRLVGLENSAWRYTNKGAWKAAGRPTEEEK